MKTTLLAAMVLTGIALSPAGAQPRLERSEPSNGARDVPVSLEVIRLHFDQPMKTDTWTLWQSDRGTFPPLKMDADGPWRDARVCELRLGRLEPATTYAIQLNSDRRQGFRSASGATPLPITVIVFTTARAAGDQRQQSEPPAGRKPTPAGDPRRAGARRAPQDAAPGPAGTQPADLPRAFTTYRCIDNGGLRSPRTGQFLEAFRLLMPKSWRFQGGLHWVANEKPPQQMTRADFLVPVRGQWSVSSPDAAVCCVPTRRRSGPTSAGPQPARPACSRRAATTAA